MAGVKAWAVGAALAVAVGGLVLPALGGPAAAQDLAGTLADQSFNPQTATLDNGLQIVVIPNDRAPVVTHMVWYRAGATDEAWGESGAAHFLEHMMFRGSENVAPGEFSNQVASIGGQDNAFTSWDYTAYHQTIPSDQLGLVMRMEADRMGRLTLDPALIEPEREVVQEERRSRTDNNPEARFFEYMDGLLYPQHPYGRPIIGWADEIAGLDHDALQRFYDQWYAPNNAILVVAGDASLDQVVRLARGTYGRLPRRDVPDRVLPPVQDFMADLTIVRHDPQVRQPSFLQTWQAPNHLQAPGNDDYALTIAVEILGQGRTSRLYRELVVDRGLFTSIGMSYRPSLRDTVAMYVYGPTNPEADPAEIEAAIQEVLQAAIDDGVTEEEMTRARRSILVEAIYDRDSATGPAYAFGAGVANGYSVDEIDQWPQLMNAVTTDDVNRVIRTYFDNQPQVVARLLPAAEENQ